MATHVRGSPQSHSVRSNRYIAVTLSDVHFGCKYANFQRSAARCASNRYRNLDGKGTFSSKIVINASALGAYSLVAFDVDQDGTRYTACAPKRECYAAKTFSPLSSLPPPQSIVIGSLF
eukprot:6213932-Pleurochrysis_carterae.AAC.3